MHILSKTARAVAAVFHFAAVAIENTVAKIGVWSSRRLDLQELVEADTELPVGI